MPVGFSTETATLYAASDGLVVDGTVCARGDIIYGTYVKYDGEGVEQGNVWFIKEIGSINTPGTPLTNHMSSANWTSLTLADLQIDENGYVFYEDLTPERRYIQLKVNGSFGLRTPVTANENCVKAIRYEQPNGNQNLWIQIGANAGQGMFLSLVNATAKGVGIIDPTLDVMSYSGASSSISRLDNAIDRVSGYRSHFGAQQNRLECAKDVNDNTSENTQYAESEIRDVDMAKEMVENSKNNILEQVGQSMLVQANLSTQGVLSLIG